MSIREPKKTRLAALMLVVLACLAIQSATAQLSAPPPPINSYVGDPGLPGDPASCVAFNADVYVGNTHKTDGVLYGFLPATRRDDFEI